MRDRTYRTIGPFELGLDLSIPVLLAAAVVVGNMMTDDDWRTRVTWSTFFVLFASNFVVRQWLFAHRVTLREDGHVELHRPGRVLIVHPASISSIRAHRWFRPFLSVQTTHGIVLVPREWVGLASFVGHLRRNNPAVDVRDVD